MMVNFKRFIWFLFLLVFIVLQLVARDNDWPCWRGVKQDGISRERTWNPMALNKGAKILWRAGIGQGHSNVSIKDGLLVTQGSVLKGRGGKEKIYQETLVCFDALTGQKKWQTSQPADYTAHAGPRATPAIEGLLVYAIGSNLILTCQEVQSGKVVWIKNLIEENLSTKTKWGFSGSPVIDGDRVILNAGSAGLALNKFTGEVIWKSGGRCWGLATPVLTKISGKRVALIHTERELLAVDLKTGHQIWSFPWPYVDCDPVITDNRVYLTGGKPGNQRAKVMIKRSSGELIKSWPHRKMNLAFQSPVYYRGNYYGMTYDKKVHHFQCFDPGTGDLKWEKKLNDYAGFSMAGDFFLLLESSGYLSILDARADSFNPVSRVRIFKMDLERKGAEPQPQKCWTAPVLCNGMIYIRNNYGEIACVDVRANS